ncbi:LysR family transcriptional regulator [Acetonema longum]|uniref:LysR family transcriptional regulator n=1 Tax=Acetonema longum DSM 6540 TaxID=1009370 RepID=F7NFT5_9FIRM|nr:LysR family transcriptional regulator [Acetonema longum]EGO65096.1 LysR family transcriptional regulator [Acetonema longum DSM 6540]
MDDKDWMMLTIIKEERNLTKSAQRLFLSQPALTYRLQSLEQEFGVRILNRYPNGVSFTMQGEYILQCAEELLQKIKHTRECVQAMEDHIEGPLRLGISSVFAKFKMAPILKEYKQRFPNVQLSLKTGSSTSQLPDMLQNREVDIAILRGDFNWPEKKHTLLEEPFCVVSAKPLELDDLPSLPWIQYETAAITKTDYDYCTWWQEYFCAPPPPVTKVDSIEACIQLVTHGIGWTILPKIHVGNNRALFTRPVIWSNGRPMLKKTVMAYRNETLNRPAAKVFVDYILHECFD